MQCHSDGDGVAGDKERLNIQTLHENSGQIDPSFVSLSLISQEKQISPFSHIGYECSPQKCTPFHITSHIWPKKYRPLTTRRRHQHFFFSWPLSRKISEELKQNFVETHLQKGFPQKKPHPYSQKTQKQIKSQQQPQQ